jgi:hypothetical protein
MPQLRRKQEIEFRLLVTKSNASERAASDLSRFINVTDSFYPVMNALHHRVTILSGDQAILKQIRA